MAGISYFMNIAKNIQSQRTTAGAGMAREQASIDNLTNELRRQSVVIHEFFQQSKTQKTATAWGGLDIGREIRRAFEEVSKAKMISPEMLKSRDIDKTIEALSQFIKEGVDPAKVNLKELGEQAKKGWKIQKQATVGMQGLLFGASGAASALGALGRGDALGFVHGLSSAKRAVDGFGENIRLRGEEAKKEGRATVGKITEALTTGGGGLITKAIMLAGVAAAGMEIYSGMRAPGLYQQSLAAQRGEYGLLAALPGAPSTLIPGPKGGGDFSKYAQELGMTHNEFVSLTSTLRRATSDSTGNYNQLIKTSRSLGATARALGLNTLQYTQAIGGIGRLARGVSIEDLQDRMLGVAGETGQIAAFGEMAGAARQWTGMSFLRNVGMYMRGGDSHQRMLDAMRDYGRIGVPAVMVPQLAISGGAAMGAKARGDPRAMAALATFGVTPEMIMAEDWEQISELVREGLKGGENILVRGARAAFPQWGIKAQMGVVKGFIGGIEAPAVMGEFAEGRVNIQGQPFSKKEIEAMNERIQQSKLEQTKTAQLKLEEYELYVGGTTQVNKFVTAMAGLNRGLLVYTANFFAAATALDAITKVLGVSYDVETGEVTGHPKGPKVSGYKPRGMEGEVAKKREAYFQELTGREQVVEVNTTTRIDLAGAVTEYLDKTTQEGKKKNAENLYLLTPDLLTTVGIGEGE